MTDGNRKERKEEGIQTMNVRKGKEKEYEKKSLEDI